MSRDTPTSVEIDLGALRHNFQFLKKGIGATKALVVVKSDAYGHGAVPVSRTLQSVGADLFGVGTVDEGVLLREAGIKKPILVLLGLIEGKFSELLRYQLTPVLYDFAVARSLHQYLEGRRESLEVHIKVDTGMTRLGLLPEDLPGFLDELSCFSTIKPVGLISHLADADNEEFSKQQALRFEKGRVEFEKRFPKPFCHIGNSLAALDKRYLNYDAVRLGIVLYGSYPVTRQRRQNQLKPVMQWKSRLVSIKKVPKGTPVSYLRSFTTRRATRIGVVPVGYADGYHRLLSNRAFVLVDGVRVPVAGTVCMDMFMVDLYNVPSARVGSEVVLLGNQGREVITADEVAKWAETIPYEITCQVAQRIPRSYIDSERR
ncbi:MAG: alanine racemase [Deltaproteobacteria bacterium]|nr:alanine racemase [Deltaproteobacteria bacterium]